MNADLDMSISYRTSPDAMESVLGEETVLLDLNSGTYFGLDEVGTHVWQGLGDGLTPAEICKRIASEFTEVPDNVEQDIRSFLGELAERKLISPA